MDMAENRKQPSSVEVINDRSRDVTNLYRVIQHYLDEFVRYFRWALVSRDEFKRLLEVSPDTLTDIQRGARFWYLQQACFGGRIVKPTFGYSVERPPKLNLLRVEEELSAAHMRLARVYIECLPYQDVVARYDRPGTIFYLDPPYYGVEGYYGEGMFDREEYPRMAAQLATIKGRFLLSLNDVPEVREVFKDFRLEEVSTRYTCANGRNQRAGELLISNY